MRAVWRLLVTQGYAVGDQAVYKRLEEEGWQPLARLFGRVSQILAQWLQPALQAYHQRHATLASFASDVVALDEMYLDQVKRRLPILRHFQKGDLELLPGKLVALFDVRLQQWRTLEYIEKATQNGREQAKALLNSLKAGTLILADLGYFGFEWFDQLIKNIFCFLLDTVKYCFNCIMTGTCLREIHSCCVRIGLPILARRPVWRELGRLDRSSRESRADAFPLFLAWVSKRV